MSEDTEDFLCGQPILRVKDVDAAVAFYRDKLGFDVAWVRHDEGSSIASVGRGSLCVLLADHGPSGASWVYSHVDSRDRVDAIHEEFKASGVEIDEPPMIRPWGLYEFCIRDCDGNVIRIAGYGEETS